MLQHERVEIIARKLKQQSSVRVTDLSRELGVSESTIRRDITEMAKEGQLKKVFGGAVAPMPMPVQDHRTVNTTSRAMAEKEVLRAEEKTEVAAFAAELIREGDLVYIDAGTTTGSMIDHITCADATYVTNGVRHAMRLAARGLRTYLLSGRVKTKTEAVIGYDAVGSLGKYHFNKCFIGTDGIDEECGLTTADIDESMVKTEAIARSGEVYILADSSKFGLVASVTFAPLDAGTVITDRLPDPAYRTKAKVMELRGSGTE